MLIVVLLGAATVFSTNAQAASFGSSPFYAGASLGPSEETGYNNNVAVKVFAGYRILASLAIEAEAGFLGKFTESLGPGSTTTDESYVAAVMAVGRLPIDDHNLLYGKVGGTMFHDLTTNTVIAGSIYCPSCTSNIYTSSSNTYSGLTFGVGYQHRFVDLEDQGTWWPDTVRVEAQAYGNNVNILDVGVIYDF